MLWYFGLYVEYPEEVADMHVLCVSNKPECSIWIHTAVFCAESTQTCLDTKDVT